MTLLEWLQWNVRTNANLQQVMVGEEMEESSKEHVSRAWVLGNSIAHYSSQQGGRIKGAPLGFSYYINCS